MDNNSRGSGDFSRPPPTSPRGHPKKRPRREGPPPRPRDDAEWSRPPPASISPSIDRFKDDEDARETKPHHLGNYLIRPEFKIRGNSFAGPKSEAGCDSDRDPHSTFLDQLDILDRDFVAVAQGIFANTESIETSVTKSRLPANHIVVRAAAGIKDQLDRLNDVYQAIDRGMRSVGDESHHLAARNETLIRGLEDSRTSNFKLSCVNKDLKEQVDDLRSAAAETEVKVRLLKRDVEGLEAKHGRLETSNRELREDRRKTGAEKLWLEDIVRKRDAEIEKGAAENRRLQSLVEEKDKEIEGLKSNNLGLQGVVQQRDAELEEARTGNTRLQSLIRDKNAQIISLAAHPMTPQSPLVMTGPFPFPVAPIGLTSEPEPFIKQEVPDQASTGVVSARPSAPGEQLLEPTQQLYHVGAGAANILGKLFHIDRSITYSGALTAFLARLGAAPEESSINVTTATGFWSLQDPWAPNHNKPKLHLTLEEQFTRLCLLFPFPGNGTTNQKQGNAYNGEDPATFHLLTALLTNLTKVDHSASPRAGLAFLQTMSTLVGIPTPAPTEPPNYTTRTALLGILLCELCRTLEAAFPDVPRRYNGWDVPLFFSSDSVSAHDKSPLNHLAALLRDTDRSAASADTVRKGLAASCGDQVCFFTSASSTGAVSRSQPHPSKPEASSRATDGAANICDGAATEKGEREIGLLHCGNEGTTTSSSSSSCFLMIDFIERSLRAVDCSLAGMRPNAAEPRKLDLIVARQTQGDGDEEEEELFRLAAAPRDVAAFWVRYAMGDV